jgi:ribosomal protein L29
MAKVSELTDQLATLRLQQATQQVCICTTSMLGTQHAWHSS